jgi:ribosomal protein S18 acetylase RimI-like enzyme
MLAQLRERGSPGVHLGVDPMNENAISFYRHLGFEDVSDEADASLMARRL